MDKSAVSQQLCLRHIAEVGRILRAYDGRLALQWERRTMTVRTTAELLALLDPAAASR